MSPDAIFLKSDEKFDYFRADYNGTDVHFRKCRTTEKIEMNMNDGARAMGYESFDDLLAKEPKAMELYCQFEMNGKGARS